MKILIVDDHDLSRKELSGLISAQPDMSVSAACASVRDAVQQVRRLHPDLILVDFNLSDGTGLDAARLILAAQPEARIIFLTNQDEDERLFAAVRLGVKGLLMKNIPADRLLAALRGVERGEAAITREMTARLMGEFARRNRPSGQAASPFAGLTARELQVVRELATDATNSEIAERLFISENTVRNHMHNILKKLGMSNRREVINLARQYSPGGKQLG